jgi:hypothetical protein
MSAEPPPAAAAVLEALEGQRQEVRRWAFTSIKSVEDHRDRELSRLDRAAGILGGSTTAPTPAGSKRGDRKPPRRKRARPGSAQSSHEKCEAVFRLLGERGAPLAKGEIRRALQITDFAAGRALRTLSEQGRVRRSGTGSATRYLLKGSTPGGVAADSTVQGRILGLIAERAHATLEELAQALRLSTEVVRSECGVLLAEEEIRMDRRHGRSVYVLTEPA